MDPHRAGRAGRALTPLAVLLAAATALSACSGTTGSTTGTTSGTTTGTTSPARTSPTTTSPTTTSPSTTSPGPEESGIRGYSPAVERARLQKARALWAQAGLRDYDLAVGRSCFCVGVGVVRFEVRDGRSTAVAFEPMDGRGATTSPPASAVPEGTPTTVEALLDTVAAELDKAEKVSVVYDARGVPTRIDADRILDAIDDEMSWTAAVTPR